MPKRTRLPKEKTSVNAPAPPDIGLDAFLKGVRDRPLPPSPEQQAAALRIERERIHNDNLKEWEALYLFLIATGITEEEVRNIFSECDVEGRIGEIFQSQVEFLADHAAERWPELVVSPEQFRRAGHSVFLELYTDLSANLRDVIRFLLTVKLCDGIGLEMSEADLNVLRRELMPSLLKTVSSPARRRKGSGRPRKTSRATLEREVKSAGRKAKSDGEPVTLPNVAKRLNPPLNPNALSSKLADYRIKWSDIKNVIISGRL